MGNGQRQLKEPHTSQADGYTNRPHNGKSYRAPGNQAEHEASHHGIHSHAQKKYRAFGQEPYAYCPYTYRT